MKVTDAMQSILEKQSKTAAQQKTPVSQKTGLSASTMQTDSLTNPYMESVRGSAEGIKADYDDLARDLYISYMDGQTKAKESLGMSGAGDSGLAETSMVRMQNSYQNALRENERARDTAMQNLRTQIGSYGQQGALSTAEMNALYRGIETGDYTVKEEKTPATSFDTAIIPQVHYDTSPTAEKRTTEPDLPANAAKTGADYSLINSGALYGAAKLRQMQDEIAVLDTLYREWRLDPDYFNDVVDRMLLSGQLTPDGVLGWYDARGLNPA